MRPGDRYRGMASATGSAGTIASGDYMKQVFPDSKIAASEALQCPTLLENGFGSHRIEGIGDKHVPWIHNSKNTDLVVAIDDNAVVNLARFFNEENGHQYLVERGVPEAIVSQLDLLGFSGISNVLTAIKVAKYYEMDENDIMLTVLTDSMELYRSRLHEMHMEHGRVQRRRCRARTSRATSTASPLTTCWNCDTLIGAGSTISSTTPGSSSRARPMTKSRTCGFGATTGPKSRAQVDEIDAADRRLQPGCGLKWPGCAKLSRSTDASSG